MRVGPSALLLALALASVPSIEADTVSTYPPTPSGHPLPPGINNNSYPTPFLPPVNGASDGAAVVDRLSTCRARCPNSLLCVGDLCLFPEPICGDLGCAPDHFCDSPFNSTQYGAFNAAVLSGKLAFSVSHGRAVNITIDASLTINPSINFTDFLSRVHDGGYVDGVCKSLTPVCNATSCGKNSVCSPFEGCKRCDACGNVDLTPILNGDFDPSSIVQRRNITRGDGHGDRVGSGDLAQIPNGFNVWANFTFGDDGDGSRVVNGSCIATFNNDTWADIDRLFTNIEQAAVQVARGARISARDLAVIANSTLEFALGGDGAHCGANRSVSVNGSLVIRGSATDDDVARGISGGRFDFPADSTNNTVGPNAIANVAGGVDLTGDLGGLKVSIAASGSASASCSVPRNGSLHSSTDILGVNGGVTVYGSFNFTGRKFQPKLSIPDGGNVTIDVGRDGNFTCGHLNLTRGGHVSLRSHGNNTFFSNFSCDWNSTFRIRVDSIAALGNRSTVLFTYSTFDVTYRARFHCHVELYDDTQVLPLVNPNNGAASRRLLANAGTVTWAPNGAFATTADSTVTSAPTATPVGGNTAAPTPTPGTPSSSSSSSTGSSNLPNSAIHATPALLTLALVMIARMF